MKTKIILICLCLGFIAAAPARSFAADKDNTEDALKKRFAERLPKLQKLKASGVIGETYKGYVDFVKDKQDDATDLVKEENSDRDALYKLFAAKTGTTAEKVAERNAQRNFEKAKAGEYLQDADGKWHKKEG